MKKFRPTEVERLCRETYAELTRIWGTDESMAWDELPERERTLVTTMVSHILRKLKQGEVIHHCWETNYVLSGELYHGYRLAFPMHVQIDKITGPESYMVSEPRFAMHATAKTQKEAITLFKQSLVLELVWFSQIEEELGGELPAQLAYLRASIIPPEKVKTALTEPPEGSVPSTSTDVD